MNIQIIGSGCARCKSLFEVVSKAVNELGISPNLEKIEDISKIMELGIVSMPAMIIDGDVVSSGKVLSIDEVKEIIRKRSKNEQAS